MLPLNLRKRRLNLFDIRIPNIHKLPLVECYILGRIKVTKETDEHKIVPILLNLIDDTTTQKNNFMTKIILGPIKISEALTNTLLKVLHIKEYHTKNNYYIFYTNRTEILYLNNIIVDNNILQVTKYYKDTVLVNNILASKNITKILQIIVNNIKHNDNKEHIDNNKESMNNNLKEYILFLLKDYKLENIPQEIESIKRQENKYFIKFKELHDCIKFYEELGGEIIEDKIIFTCFYSEIHFNLL